MLVDDAIIDEIPGWFMSLDRQLFRWFLGQQREELQRGGIAELGVYLGKSAVLLGGYVQPDETLTVIDLFESVADDPENQTENEDTYGELTQTAFEGNYARVHGRLPIVIQDYSNRITRHVTPRSQRFVHVDASHLYDHVRGDIQATQEILADQGVVVFDDMRSVHTFGVAAAVWQEVTTGSLAPLIISENKLYATWSNPDRWLARLRGWLPLSPFDWEEQVVAAHRMFRAAPRPEPPVLPPPPSTRRRLALAATPPALLSRVERLHQMVMHRSERTGRP